MGWEMWVEMDRDVVAHPEMWWLIRRCGGSLVALQTTEALVPGSNTASLTVEKL